MNDEFVRIFIASFLLLFGLVVVIPLYRRKWKPLTITKARSRQNRLMEYALLGGLIAWLAWLLHVIVRGTNDAMVNALGGIYDFGEFKIAAMFLGVALALGGLGLVALGIAEMKDQWRIGIDEEEPQTEIITTGVFRVLRHPIYIGICLMTIGATMLLPHLATIGLTTASLIGAVVQMKLEEKTMRAHFGEAYK